MFLLRSIFWLSLAFVVMAPPAANLGSSVAGLRHQAVQTAVEVGTDLIAEQILQGALASAAVLVDPPVFPRQRPPTLG